MRARQTALALTLSALALSACGTTAPADNSATDSLASADQIPANEGAMAAEGENASTMAPADTATYLAQAGAGDLFEQESSKAMLETSKDADVRKFAQMMIDQHSQSTAKIKAAAQAAGLEVTPPKLNPAQQAMLNEIKGAAGPGRDAAYLRHQVTAHNDALELHRGYAAGGETAQLKAVASEIVPVVEKHIAELQRLNAG